MYAALVLLALTLLVNVLGELIIRGTTGLRLAMPPKGAAK
jgi:hypothetical protein